MRVPFNKSTNQDRCIFNGLPMVMTAESDAPLWIFGLIAHGALGAVAGRFYCGY
jgi:hypothetical protein